VISLRSDGKPIVVSRGRYLLGFAFRVEPLNLAFYASDENCEVGSSGRLTPTANLRNVRVTDNSYVSVFANLEMHAGGHLSCTDNAGRHIALKLAEVK
jgi:hypothetical protein